MKNCVRSFLLFFLITSVSISYAITFTTVANGNWNDPSTWDANGSPGSYWNSSDIVIVQHAVNLNQYIGFDGALTVNASGSLIGSSNSIALNNGASFSAAGEVSVNQLTLNSSSTFSHTEKLTLAGDLTVGSGSSIISNDTVVVGGRLNNNAGTITAHDVYTIASDLTNNNGTITFHEPATVGGKFDNNNSSASITINESLIVSGDITNNSGASIDIPNNALMETSGNLTNNSGSSITSSGRINATGNFANNGGTTQNNGIFDLGGNFTQNGGSFSNNGGMVVDGSFTINGGGTVDGNGILRVDQITNFGSFNGTVDICRIDDSTPTNVSGSGSYNVNLTYCTAASSGALPIVLKSFKARFISDNTVLVNWTSLTEVNNNYYTILSSTDGKTFRPTKKITGAGNSTKETSYKAVLTDVKNDLIYLKLQQTDFDGKFEIFEPIAVSNTIQRANTSPIQLYPNPAGSNDNLRIKLNGFEADRYTISLLDLKGQLYAQQSITVKDEAQYAQEIELQKQSLKKGIYFVRIQSSTSIVTSKYIVR